MPKKCLLLIVIISTLFLSACGRGTEEEKADAIIGASDYLSIKDCQSALDLLDSIGFQGKNAQYLKTLASAYACKASYSTIKLFADDLAKTSTPQPIGGMATYSTSLSVTDISIETEASFIELQKAIDILLYAGEISKDVNPTPALRKSIFGERVSGEINSQVTFMLMAQLGKFIKINGNTNNLGKKGLGLQANFCFTNYEDVDPNIQAFIQLGGQTGACSTLTSGQTDLDKNAPNRRENLCKGLVIMNNIVTLLPTVAASAAGGDLDVVNDFLVEVQAKKTMAITAYPVIEETLDVLSQKKCEEDTDIDLKTLASAYAFFYEALVL